MVAPGIGEEAETVPLPGLDRQRDIGERGFLLQQLGDLERAREAAMHALRHVQPINTPAIKMDLAGIGPGLADDLADERRLARAIGADQRMDFARAHVERHVVGRGARRRNA